MATMRPSRMTIVALSIGAPPVPSITRAPRKAVAWACASLDTPMTNANHAPISEQSGLIRRIANPPLNDQMFSCFRAGRGYHIRGRLCVTANLAVNVSDGSIGDIAAYARHDRFGYDKRTFARR